MGPKEWKAQLRELDTNCNSSSFLKGTVKMADVDIDPFGDHDKTDAQPDETGETTHLIPGGVGEELLGKRNTSKEHCLEENLKQLH